MSLISWQTFRRREGLGELTRFYDGIVPSYESVHPWLVRHGYIPVCEDSDYCLFHNTKPKRKALELLGNLGINPFDGDIEYIYHVHLGSSRTTMMDGIRVYRKKGGAE